MHELIRVVSSYHSLYTKQDTLLQHLADTQSDTLIICSLTSENIPQLPLTVVVGCGVQKVIATYVLSATHS